MYTWLTKEIDMIKTRRYHLIHLPPSSQSQEMSARRLLPPSYLEFVDKFGHSKLYKSGTGYIIHVFEIPHVKFELDDNLYIQFGAIMGLTAACYRVDDLSFGTEAPVFELFFLDGEYEIEPTYLSFDRWLFKNANEIKANISEGEWELLVKGPPPFTQDELRIVEERKKFAYSLIGFTDSGDAKILIKNQSQISLPYLSVGVKWKGTNQPAQTIWLPIHDLEPGDSRIILHDAYKKFIPREGVELVDLPDPEPEDMDIYWEFKYSFSH